MTPAFKQLLKEHLPRAVLDPLLRLSARMRDRQRGYAHFAPPPVAGDDPLAAYFELVRSFDHRNITALDRAHNLFLIGAVLSRKPRHVLELGFGTGYVTSSLTLALRYNQAGKLTSVDNWYDTQGLEPALAGELRAQGVEIIRSGEEEFVRAAATDAYDVLVSDADHVNSASWLDEHLRIVEHNGLLFFHDTNQPDVYPALAQIEDRIAQRGLPHYHFTQSTRPDEHCQRGWLFVINQKPAPT